MDMSAYLGQSSIAKSVKNSIFLFTKWDQICRWRFSSDSSDINQIAIFGQSKRKLTRNGHNFEREMYELTETFILFRDLLKQKVIREKLNWLLKG